MFFTIFYSHYTVYHNIHYTNIAPQVHNPFNFILGHSPPAISVKYLEYSHRRRTIDSLVFPQSMPAGSLYRTIYRNIS